MADIDWPSGLRAAIQNTKQTTQGLGSRESEPAAGPSYTEFFSDDLPTFMTFNLKFTRQEAMYFDSWCRTNKIFIELPFFNFPITDEYGATDQEARFYGSRPSKSEQGNVVTYSGCNILIPDYIRPDDQIVFEYYNIYGTQNNDQIGAFDWGINEGYPNV